MKAILISIQSPHACNILNLIKLWEIRKKFPSDYVGWVYIYVTKGKPYLKEGDIKPMHDLNPYNPFNYCWYLDDDDYRALNGKVVARFWCDKVEDFWNLDNIMLAETCLTKEELHDYLKGNKGYAIHITNLEIFDKPKEISEFHKIGYDEAYDLAECGWDSDECLDYHQSIKWLEEKYRLRKAPQSWCWIEV